MQKKSPSSPLTKQNDLSKSSSPVKKDTFYNEWEKKYQKLHAGNLLAKTPFKRHVLFLIKKEENSLFIKKIFDAVNTRLMDATFIIKEKSIETYIEKYQPTHLITTKKASSTSCLPTILIENLSSLETNSKEKKALWEELKKTLKG